MNKIYDTDNDYLVKFLNHTILKVMEEIPLFPINRVLFPGMPLRLHIFEERYKQMIQDCLSFSRSFGIILIRKCGGPLVDPFNVGCSADIIKLEKLPEERLNLISVGMRRFRILSIYPEKEYMVGSVEYLDHDDCNCKTNRLYSELIRYFELTNQEVRFKRIEKIIENPIHLASFCATILEENLKEKQRLLMINKLQKLIDILEEKFKRYNQMLSVVMPQKNQKMMGPYSRN